MARALGQPHDLVTTSVVTHPGTRHVRQAVPVDVSVGQLGAGAQGLVVVFVVVVVLMTVLVWMTVAVTVDTRVTMLVVVAVLVVATVTVFVVASHVLVQLAPRQMVVGVRVICRSSTCPATTLWGGGMSAK